MKNNLKYLLIIIPVASAILALSGFGFYAKSGVAVSCALIVLLCSDKSLKKTTGWLAAGLLISVVGDWFLSHRNGIPIRFVYGIIAFFIAHTSFLIFSLLNGKIHKLALAILTGGYLTFFILLIYPNVDDILLLICVLFYLFISCFSLATAAGLRFAPLSKCLFVSGIASILFSDTTIALREFVGIRQWDYLILPSYYLAHILMAMAIMTISDAKPRSTE